MAFFEFTINHNGKYYEAGEDVPVGVAVNNTDMFDVLEGTDNALLAKTNEELKETLKDLGVKAKDLPTKKTDMIDKIKELETTNEENIDEKE